jgi:two-component system phosphate regulon sensor histidine kinase PhoR
MQPEGTSAKSIGWKGNAWKFGLGLAWMVFNLSLAAWWLIFGLRQIDFVQTTIAHLAPEQAEHAGHVADFVRQQRMLISEGSILIVSVVAGGGALLYYILRERKRGNQIRAFFATFSHELKTSIASLRLQVESLADDFADSSNPLFTRLVKDSVRLEIQLENSLHLSQLDSSRFFIEKIDLNRTLGALAHQWPGVTLETSGENVMLVDHRAFETIVKNLIQNAIVHGGAKRVTFNLRKVDGNRLSLRVVDDGAGFRGDLSQLGKLFVRHNAKSGSGVGLFLVRTLIERMGGETRFVSRLDSGFDVEIEMPAEPGGSV